MISFRTFKLITCKIGVSNVVASEEVKDLLLESREVTLASYAGNTSLQLAVWVGVNARLLSLLPGPICVQGERIEAAGGDPKAPLELHAFRRLTHS